MKGRTGRGRGAAERNRERKKEIVSGCLIDKKIHQKSDKGRERTSRIVEQQSD